MMHTEPRRRGWIEVICGCMYSGKTEELQRRLRRATYTKLTVKAFKPRLDDRYSATDIVTHDGSKLPSIIATNSRDIAHSLKIQDADIVGIDEAQFFNADLPEVVTELAANGKRVIVAGLDLDFRGEPFGPMPHLLAIADEVAKVHAYCTVCGGVATRTFRLTEDTDQIKVGSEGIYEARCREHWTA